MSTARKFATWEDLLDIPDGLKAEVVGGVVCMSPSPRPVHGFACAALAARIFSRFGSTGTGADGGDQAGWWILPEVDVRLTRYDIVRPDVSGWRRSRMPKLPTDVPVDVVPDWVCEVLSPSTEARDRGVKMPLYAAAGIPHAWLVSPDLRLVEGYELLNGRWTVLGVWADGAVVEVAPFGGLLLDVSGLFPPLDRPVEPAA